MTEQDAARWRVVHATRKRAEAAAEWRRAILDALAKGVGPTEVAALAGCTRQRVYQIKAEAATNRLDSPGSGG